jgi:hypothetical protein
MLEKSRQAGDLILCELDGVRGGDTGFPVSLVRDRETGRIVLRAVNEGGFSCTDIDWQDLLVWLGRVTSGQVDADAINSAIAAREHTGGHAAGD